MDALASVRHQDSLTPQVVNGGAEPINQVEHHAWKVSTVRP
ncbi:hypothetical protein ABZ543_21835 [Streptomyces roseifaciens]